MFGVQGYLANEYQNFSPKYILIPTDTISIIEIIT